MSLALFFPNTDLAIYGLVVAYELQNCFFYFLKKCCWNFDDFIGSITSLGSVDISTL